jgi:hypothetical protein
MAPALPGSGTTLLPGMDTEPMSSQFVVPSVFR